MSGQMTEEEKKAADKILDEEDHGPSKPGTGGGTPKVKKKPKTIKQIRESWKTPAGGYQVSHKSGVSLETLKNKETVVLNETQSKNKGKAAGDSKETPDAEISKVTAASKETQKNKKGSQSVASIETQPSLEMEDVGPEMQLELGSAASSTPKSKFVSEIEQMHGLIIGGNNKTVLEASSVLETPQKEKSKLDGSWEFSKYQNAKAAGKARRQMERRKRARERAELSASGSAQPDPKKTRDDATASSDNTDVEPEKAKNPRFAQYVPGAKKPSYSSMVQKNDLVCRVISKDRTRSLNDADFGYVSTAYNCYLDRHVAIKDLMKLQCKVAGFHDGQIRLCMVSQAGVDLLKKVVTNMKPKEGRPEMEFLPPGEEPFVVYKVFSSNLSPRLEGGLERFVEVVRGMNPELNLEGSSIVVRIAKYVENRNKDKSPFLVLMLRVSRDLVPIIQRCNYMLNYTFGPLVLHVRADPAAPLESDERATEQMELDKARSAAALAAPSE